MRLWKNMIAIGAISALTACGGSSSNDTKKDSDLSPDSSGTTEYGRVIDGYLENAIVCIDSNKNRQCDAEETSVKTDNQGRFPLKDFKGKALLVQAKAGITRDLDDGLIINSGFIMQAPASHNGLVTPFTSLQSNLLTDRNPIQALEKLSDVLSVNVEVLTQDYIAQNNAQLQLIAKAIVNSIQKTSTQALSQDFITDPSQQQGIVESLAWQQFTPEVLAQLNNIIVATANAGAIKTAHELSDELIQQEDDLTISALEFDIAINGEIGLRDDDNDGIINAADNCPAVSNPDQVDLDNNNRGDICDPDQDNDGLIDGLDNCPSVSNADQIDLDDNKIGDACDSDADNDGIIDGLDNCPALANADQVDLDKNNIGDACDSDQDNDSIIDGLDNCPTTANSDQVDLDNNNIGDACDRDGDEDSIIDGLDNCPTVPNTNQADLDNDKIGDVCDNDRDNDSINNELDNCPAIKNTDQNNLDNDAFGDVCDNDIDGDSVLNEQDNCPANANADQADLDSNNIGDICDTDQDGDSIIDGLDNCPAVANPDQTDLDNNNVGDACDSDQDGDSIIDGLDNCPTLANPDQTDLDKNNTGDACDPDQDKDNIIDGLDNCPAVANPDQADLDNNNTGDACDPDQDNDNIIDGLDNCPAIANPDQTDLDNNNTGDACDSDQDNDTIIDGLDNCPTTANPEQTDLDGNNIGDVCDLDQDEDGIIDGLDNCPAIANADQADLDGNNKGDVCDADKDGDGIVNLEDNCPSIANTDQANLDGDLLGDVCDSSDDRPQAANSIIIDDENDRISWTPADNSKEYQYRIGEQGQWLDTPQQAIQVSEKAQGKIYIRIKPNAEGGDDSVPNSYRMAVSDLELSPTAFVKLDAQLNRLATDAKHISEDNGTWVCTRDNRAADSVYWLADPQLHDYYDYENRSSADSALTTINQNYNTNCGFNNWSYPILLNIASLVENSDWGFDKYFPYLRSSGSYGYHLADLSPTNDYQQISSAGVVADLASYGYLQPMRRLQSAEELLTQLENQLANIVAPLAQVQTLAATVNTAKQAAMDAFLAATSIEQLENLISSSYSAQDNELDQAQETAEDALSNNQTKLANTLIIRISGLLNLLANNIDGNVSEAQVAQAKSLQENADYLALKSSLNSIKTSLGQVNSKIELTKVRIAQLKIQQQHTLAIANEVSAINHVNSQTSASNNAATITDYAQLAVDLETAKSFIENKLSDLGDLDSTSSYRIIGQANSQLNKSQIALTAMQANEHSSAENLASAISLNQNNVQKTTEIKGTRASLQQALTDVAGLITSSESISKNALAVYNPAISVEQDVNSDQQNLVTVTAQLKTATDAISNAAEAKVRFESAMQLLLTEGISKQEIEKLNTQVNSIQAYLDLASQPLNVLDASLQVYLDQLKLLQQNSVNQALASHQQALASYDAAWATAGFTISWAEAQFNNKPYAKLDHKGRLIYTAATQSQGWTCIQQGDSLSAENKMWALLESASDNQVNGINYIEALASVTQANNNQLCGKDDWSLPSLSQLQSLATEELNSFDKIDDAVFINHNDDGNFSGDQLINRFGYWSKDIDSSNANQIQVYSFAEYISHPGQAAISTSVINDDTLADGYTIAARLYREDRISPAPAVTKIDEDGRRALTDDSNSACIRIGDQVWTQHKLVIDQDQEVRGSDLEALITRLNSHNSDTGMCGVTDWSLPTSAQLTRMAIDKHLPFIHKDSGNSYGDYWLSETEAAYRFVFDIRTLEKSSYARSSSYEYSFRAVGTISGAIPDALPVPVAPMNGVVDDINDTFSWDYVVGFTSATDYEFSLDSGASWNPVVSLPLDVGDYLFEVGSIRVRVKAVDGNNNTGLSLISTEAYTGAIGCFGVNATEIDGICYRYYAEEKNWSSAKAFCETDSASLVSKDYANFNNLGNNLALESSNRYWLLEEDHRYSGYAYYLYNSSNNWQAINHSGTIGKSRSYSFICAK